MNNCEILALALCSEAMSIASGNYFLGKVKSSASDFPNLIDRGNYNRLRRYLITYHNYLTILISNELNKDENIFMIDPMLLPVCNIARAGTNQVLSENYNSSPDIEYSAMTKT